MVRVRRGFAGLASVLVVGGVMVVGVSGASASVACSQSGSTETCSYASGVSATLSVPAGVTSVTITAVGGSGGAAVNNVKGGGEGGIITSTRTVAPGDSLSITVGANGVCGSFGTVAGCIGTGGSGAGNGGSISGGGGGGGGGSAVTDGGATLVVAGGGGGSGQGPGGNADQSGGILGGGSAGTLSGGAGAGGCFEVGVCASSGSGMNGGGGGPYDFAGGGGGYFGGGAAFDGGGGGGASYPAAATLWDTTATPSVTITYTVPLASPSIGTSQQPGSATVGSSIADKATVSGGDSPTGTVTFRLYSNSTGSGTPLFTDTETLVGGSATSAGYTATATATDYWVATYNGDTNNSSVTSGTAAEPVTIKAAATSLAAAPQVVLLDPREGVGLGVVEATLTSAGKPVSGQTITFSVAGRQLCSAKTNASGVARCTVSLFNELLVLLRNQYTASYAATTGYTSSTASTPAVELK